VNKKTKFSDLLEKYEWISSNPNLFIYQLLVMIPYGQLNLFPDQSTDIVEEAKLIDNWAKRLDKNFNNYMDFANNLLIKFPVEDFFNIEPIFYLTLPKINNFDHLVSLIRQKLIQLKERKYYSVAITRSIGGKPKHLEEISKDAEKTYKLILQYGELIFTPTAQLNLFQDNKNAIEEMQKGLSPFEKMYYDFLINQMAPNGTIPILANYKEVIKKLNMPDNGRSWSLIKNANNKFANIEWRCLIKLPNPNRDKKERYILYPPEKMLKYPEYFETENNEIRKSGIIPIPYLPGVIIQLKQAGNYLVKRDERLFGLDPTTYIVITTLHEMFRMNITKSDWSRNLNSLIHLFNWNIKAKHEKESLEKLHSIFNLMINEDYGLDGFYISYGNEKIKEDWYNIKRFNMTKIGKKKKRQPNFDLFTEIIYHFIYSDSFKKDHEKIIEKRNLIEQP